MNIYIIFMILDVFFVLFKKAKEKDKLASYT